MVGKTYWGGVTGLIDPSTNESGYIDANGNLKSGSVSCRTDFISALYDSYEFRSPVSVNGKTVRIHGYDSSKAWVMLITEKTCDGSPLSMVFDKPDGIEYIRVSYQWEIVDYAGLFRKI